jgi:Zn-dependent membrane protease YugP
LIIGGLLLSSLSSVFVIAAYIGVAFFALSTIFQLITLPVEMNASKRALQQIQANGILYSNEMQGAKEVLNAAALTYVAALAVSITQLIRFLMILRRRR